MLVDLVAILLYASLSIINITLSFPITQYFMFTIVCLTAMLRLGTDNDCVSKLIEYSYFNVKCIGQSFAKSLIVAVAPIIPSNCHLMRLRSTIQGIRHYPYNISEIKNDSFFWLSRLCTLCKRKATGLCSTGSSHGYEPAVLENQRTLFTGPLWATWS